MKIWRSFGASVTGPGHIAAGKPNQDAWASFHHVWGDGLVVSDGLGSKPFSNFGSHAACLAVAHSLYRFREDTDSNRSVLSELIRNKWISLLKPLTPRDCAATCLFAYRMNDGMVLMGMLGDGLVAALRVDGSVMSLSEDKSEGFSNTTSALSPHTTSADWQWLSVSEMECQSVFLCTDGVADDLSDRTGFIRGFYDANRELSSISSARRARDMLRNWPTPKHSDDKTIACLFKEEMMDE
ncbi:MAG TPA: PP2C family serine/threonine-protein phosphatase [Candidatus Fermentibacter daniensis]|nr:PP2C family serine/threonine-protein phosphatase [Candidatus Fermentibacter daniensis]